VNESTEHYRKGMALYGEGRYPEAIEAYRLALATKPDWSDCLQALAMAQMNAGLLDEALANAKRVTELAPEDPLAFTSLSMAYQRKNMIAEAEQAQAQARMLSYKAEHGG
jgi:tetratricopeptide (TPR) repeat protein